MLDTIKNIITSIKACYFRILIIGYEDHDDEKTIKYLMRLTNLTDDEWALYKLGVHYVQHTYIKKNSQKAIFYFKHVFSKNGRLAKYAASQIGHIYFCGKGLTKNELKAAKWYKKAAKLGEPISQYNYGLSLVDGWGDEEDYAKGVYWLTKASESGITEAKKTLKKMDII